tara:strand:+ start:479 stop:760 length:282 start_codon:yes stop_codon:yes gene_type:complete
MSSTYLPSEKVIEIVVEGGMVVEVNGLPCDWYFAITDKDCILDSLREGDEVYWNDPDEGACSGNGVFVRYNADGVAVIRKDDVEMEVFVKELG